MCARIAGNVAGDEKFVFAESDDDRRAQARGDDLVGIARRQRHQRIRARHHLHGLQHGVFERRILGKFLDEVRDDFGVGFGEELVAFGDELVLQLDVIFDDAVVHHYDFAGAIAVRMGVFLGRAAVRGPARVADAVDAVERRRANGFLEIAQFPRRAADSQLSFVIDHRDPGGVVASIFEAFQAVENQRHDAFWSDIADNSAHLARPPAPQARKAGAERL